MTEAQLFTMTGWLVAALFGLLCAILGWIGNKIFTKLESMSEGLSEIASELHEKVNGLDRRLTIVETKCITNHGKGNN